MVVLIAGIADPKKPLARPLTLAALRASRGSEAALSPFDEAALEVALQLRDAEPSHRILAIVAGPGSGDPLLRSVASLRLDRVSALDTAALAVWDAQAVAAALAQAVLSIDPGAAAAKPPALVLIGREFGDFDDGSVPALLAARLGMPYRSQVTGVALEAGSLRILRQRAGFVRRSTWAPPLLASITNDARNRLRHPLLKNVMAAKKMSFERSVAPSAESPLACGALEAVASNRRGAACRMLAGPPEAMAAELAALLRRAAA